ncbi:SusC/RagA family TonB-linked outer membrane protein [Spirosoma utsteinense]|uniref:TonB-linked SusC/RagA family outer membrane protein n=1 Tax=Spirosoma utsteinense TaxID=2585773 RepID=A0ABR6WB24_9BACT|nr:SusC/RagA family TonB-linked outer membrane protein [Spirosoma utsteinense]MBC3784052.1 TonB-linked SusC/RagA family outer membrane protein [Spirosoma utsteinense]MBC3793459.1 TonB-linked SusC/RagA family outer membrane protein [Spirosoma utsteinense]
MRKVLIGTWLLSLLFCLPLLAQDASVTGRVTSSDDGSALPGVSVVVKGTTRGTTTDVNGAYRINAGSGTTLTFSFVGFKSQDVAVGNRTAINIVLAADASTLNEVVVTGFGIQRTEREIGTSVAKINNAQITQAAPVNIANGLTGKVSGLQVNLTNNGVGSSPRLTLRGNRSFLGNNQALLVVDGVISDISFLPSINPNDIDNTTILKGPSAAALYGSDASNGVLVVTTKRGTQNNKPQISYSNNTQFESISYMPGLQTQFGSNGGEAAPFYDRNYSRLYVPYENQSFGPIYDGSTQPLGYGVQIRNPDGSVSIDTLRVPYASPGKDPRKAFFNTGVTTQNDVSYRIGDNQNYFGLGLQRVDQKGVVPNDKYQRTSISLKGGRAVDKFAANGGIQFAYQQANTENGDFNQNRPVYWNVLNQPAHAPINSYPLNDITSPQGDVNGYYNAYYPNPYWQISGDNSRKISNTYTLQGSTDVSYQFNKWLNVLYRIGGQVFNSQLKSHIADVQFSDYALGDPWEAGNIASSVGRANATVLDATATRTRFTGDLLVTINPTFGNFTTKLILGQQTRQEYSRSTYTYAGALVVPGLYNIANRLGEPTVSEYNTRSRLLGAFGDFTLGYKNFLFVHATGRNDWTSLLAPANRSFFYPSVDASLVLTDAVPSLKNSSVLSFLKIRGGLSRVGQVNVAPYQLQNVFNPGTNVTTGGTGFPYGSQAGFELNNRQNDPNLKPEFTVSREVGVEMGLFDRVNLEAVYYNTTTTNQTVPIDISRATGYTSGLINTGSMVNRGIELDLRTTRPIFNLGGFTWDINTNFTYLESKVTDLYQDLARINIPYGTDPYRPTVSPGASDVFAAKGIAYPALYVSDIQRVQTTDASAPNYDATGQFAGRPVIDPATGYPILDPNLRYAGTTQPKYRFGLTNTFKYKGFNLSAVIEYRGGNVIYNALGNALEFTGAGIRSTYAGRQNFVFPESVIKNADGTFAANTNVTTKDGNLVFWTNSGYHNAGYSYVTSAAFWKLREVVLGYTIPSTILAGTKFVKSVNIAVTGRNLVMLRPKTNVFTDPEFSGGTNANDNSNAVGTTTEYQTPPTRFYGFRVSVGF